MAGAGLALTLHLLLARVLGSLQYGNYAFALSWVTILTLVATAGLDTASLRFVASYVSTGRYGLLRGFQRRAPQVVLGSASILGLLLATTSWALGRAPDSGLLLTLLAAALFLPVVTMLQLLASILRGLKSVTWALLPQNVLRPALLAGLVLVLFELAPKQSSAALVFGLDLGVSAFLLLLLVKIARRKTPGPARKVRPQFATRTWLLTGLPLAAITGIRIAMNRADVIMVGFFLGTPAAGIYSVAAQLATFIGFGLLAVNTIAAPLFAELHSQADAHRLQQIARLGAQATLCFSLLAGGGLLFLGEPVLRLFGDEFVAAYGPLAILVLAQVVNSVSGSVGFLLSMTGHERLTARVTAGAGALNLGLNAVLIPLLGLPGAAVATAVSITTWNLVLVAVTWKRLSINPTGLGPLRRVAASDTEGLPRSEEPPP